MNSDADTFDWENARTIVLVMLRHWWVFVICIAVPVAAVLFLGTRETDKYTSEAKILVRGSQTRIAPSTDEIQASRTLADYYQDLVKTRSVLERVIERLDLPFSVDSLRGRIDVSTMRSFVIIRVTDAFPENAALIVNVVAEEFVADSRDLQLRELAAFQRSLEEYGLPTDAALMSGKIGEVSILSVIEPGLPASSPIPQNSTTRVVLAAFMGSMLGLASVAILHNWRDTVDTPDRLQSACGVTALPSIPKFTHRMELSDVVNGTIDVRAAYWEPYRFLRASPQFAAGVHNGANAFLVTSPLPGDGKSTTCLSLGLTMAQEGRRTMLVDADLRKPSLHKAFGFANETGLTSFLCGAADPEEIVRSVKGPGGLDVITSGPVPVDASPLLASSWLVDFIRWVKEQYDIVLFDSSPVLSVVDPSLLSAKLDGSLLVLDASRHMRAVRSAAAMLKQTGRPVLGAVLNYVAREGEGYFYPYAKRYYPYGDGHESDGANGRWSPWLGRYMRPIRTLAGRIQRRRGR